MSNVTEDEFSIILLTENTFHIKQVKTGKRAFTDGPAYNYISHKTIIFFANIQIGWEHLYTSQSLLPNKINMKDRFNTSLSFY